MEKEQAKEDAKRQKEQEALEKQQKKEQAALDKQRKKEEAEKEKQLKKEQAEKEKQLKKEQAAELKRQKEEERQQAEEKKKAKLAKQQNQMMAFFAPKPTKPRANSDETEAAAIEPTESAQPMAIDSSSDDFDVESFRSQLNSGNSNARPFARLSKSARASRRARTRRVQLSVFVTVLSDNPFEPQP